MVPYNYGMEDDDKIILFNGGLKAVDEVDFSTRHRDIEKTKATLKASLPNKEKKGRAMVNSDEQELFCKAMAEGRNQSDAARIAYPRDKNPVQRGYELCQMEHIQKRIAVLREERAYAALLVDPQESLIRWNQIYNTAMEKGDTKTAIEAQKQIDKINGAEAYLVRQLEGKGVFRGEDEDEWKKSAARLNSILDITKKLTDLS